MREKLNCIMVIDDDEPTNFISTMLIEETECTHHLEVVDSGLKALAYLEKAQRSSGATDAPMPQLIFLDINMPCMNGWEFLEHYKKLDKERLGYPVIIMLTTSFSPDDRLRAGSICDVSAFENKPLTIDMIQRVINTFFQKKNDELVERSAANPIHYTPQ